MLYKYVGSESSVYHFELLAGGEFHVSSQYGAVEIHGHCSLYVEVFNLGAASKYRATFLVNEEREKLSATLQ